MTGRGSRGREGSGATAAPPGRRRGPDGPARLGPDCFERLGELAELVARLAREGGLDSRGAYRLRLAGDELVTNVITHGYRGRPGPIDLTGAVEPDRVWLRIEDEAPPFDPRPFAVPPPPGTDPLGCRVGGLGIFLALGGVDEFAYEYAGGRNRSTVAVHRPGTRECAPVGTEGG